MCDIIQIIQSGGGGVIQREEGRGVCKLAVCIVGVGMYHSSGGSVFWFGLEHSIGWECRGACVWVSETLKGVSERDGKRRVMGGWGRVLRGGWEDYVLWVVVVGGSRICEGVVVLYEG